jgi:hypothetical protein
MRPVLILISILILIVAAISSGNLAHRADASTGSIPLNCDRACLEREVLYGTHPHPLGIIAAGTRVAGAWKEEREEGSVHSDSSFLCGPGASWGV